MRVFAAFCLMSTVVSAHAAEVLTVGSAQATMTLVRDGDLRTYQLATTAELRDHRPPEKQVTFSEDADHATIRSGNLLFDGLYAMAVSEARANSVYQISDDAYAHGEPVHIEAFQTGEFWKYVWTRDLSYSLDLGLAGFDPARAVNSLLFKASALKPSVNGGVNAQIVQDTGSGGSYPVSTDRVVWALGAHETLKFLSGTAREDFLQKVYPILCETIEQDRRLVFDPDDGLYRGEQSFLDWREQTYPGWSKDHVLAIGMSKALSVNADNYVLLKNAAEYAGLLGKGDVQTRYAGWADDLRRAVNAKFWDEESGLYSAYLLSDDGVSDSVRVSRYDLLGESLAILSGLADAQRAASILSRYQTGPSGPPVVWPQEKTVPIYHNQAIWPFVTAYWTKAARQTGSAVAVDAGIQSLEQLAAVNLSNMENFDFVTGKAQVTGGPRQGPVISSRRQLWSVAAYLSMVQDVVFGRETSWDGMRFRPFVTANLRNGIFRSADSIECRNLSYRGTQNCVRLHLPPAGSTARSAYALDRVELNKKSVGVDFVKRGDLQSINDWDIFLKSPDGEPPPAVPLQVVDVNDERAICGPVEPTWADAGQGGITLDHDRLTLNYAHADPANVTFNIYRDGQLRAKGIRELTWTDPASADYSDTVRSYRVGATDARSGNASHLTPAHAYRMPWQTQVIPASALHNHGGNLADGHHFENWGRPGDELLTGPVTVPNPGQYLIRVAFSNGAGPVNTGITCAVKKLEITEARSGRVAAAGYLVMPQSGDWKRFDLSSAVKGKLSPGIDYNMHIFEDEWCRNMSYLQSNERYTSANGGGDTSYNFVNIAAVHVLELVVEP